MTETQLTIFSEEFGLRVRTYIFSGLCYILPLNTQQPTVVRQDKRKRRGEEEATRDSEKDSRAVATKAI